MLIVVILLLIFIGIYLIILTRGILSKKQDVKVKNVLSQLNNYEKTHKMFDFERQIIDKLNLDHNKVIVFLIIERVILVSLAVLSYFVMGVLGIALVGAIIIGVVLNNQKKEAIQRSGVLQINDTVMFMDYFVPIIASGSSAREAFTRYINSLEDSNPIKSMLVEYYDAKSKNDYTYKTPKRIADIASVYEIALYNETIGSDDYLYIIQEAKEDLFQKSVYYNDYCVRVAEVLKPIEWAYYIGVPLIALILFGTVGDFWSTPMGWLTAILLLVLFFMFKYLCNRLAIRTIKEIL